MTGRALLRITVLVSLAGAAGLLPACVGASATPPAESPAATQPAGLAATHPSSLAEAVWMGVGKPLAERIADAVPRALGVATLAIKCHAAQGRWPAGAADLEAFAAARGEHLDLSDIRNLTVVPTDQGRQAHVSFEMHPRENETYKVNFNLPAVPLDLPDTQP